jgi:hypothetical protein
MGIEEMICYFENGLVAVRNRVNKPRGVPRCLAD